MADHAGSDNRSAVDTHAGPGARISEAGTPEGGERAERPGGSAPPASPRTRLRSHPLLRRITGYSAGSVIAAATSEAAFAAAYGWAHAGTTLASAAGFFGGAVPNYVLNRRWAWREDRRGRSPREELLLYFVVSLASFAVSAVATDWAEGRARALTSSHDWQVALVALAFLAVSAVFFVGKFVAYEVIVFTKGSPPAPDEARQARR